MQLLFSSFRCKHYGKCKALLRRKDDINAQQCIIVKKPGCDVWGKSYTVNNLPSYNCVNCQKSIASTRYAPHLEKCLGLAGRQSSRVASRRIGGGSPSFSSDDNNSTDSDVYDRSKKKKQHASVSGFNHALYFMRLTIHCSRKPSFSNGVSRVKKLKYMD